MKSLSLLIVLALLGLAGAGRAQTGLPAVPEVQLTTGNATFAVELYRKLPATDNVFFSPYSISTALAMTCLGARGDTAREMRQALHFPAVVAEPARLAATFGTIQKTLRADPQQDGFALHVANALWVQAGFKLQPDFLGLCEQELGGSARPLDFRQPDAARATINGWVAQQTRDKIKDLLPPGTLTADTRLVLTNAIYFKGQWATEFAKANTKTLPFYGGRDGQTQSETPLMCQSGSYRHLNSTALPQDKPLPAFQMLMLPYRGQRLSLIVILPAKRDGLAAVEACLHGPTIASWIGHLRPREVEVFLPRFTIAGATLSLRGPLQALGLKTAFAPPPAADFSGLDGSRELYLSEVVHQAFVEVNEEGTTAAAATGAVVGITSVQEPEPPVVFRADHPFLFLIRENRCGTILFLGRVVKP